MPTTIGSALREARLRQKIDVEEAERQTKIRTKYLRALENEEWDRLPEGAYTRSFLRTYANFLSLDGDVLVDEYRRRYETAETGATPFGEPLLREPRRPSRRSRTSPGGSRFGSGAWIGAGVLAVLGVLLVLGLTSGDNHKKASTAKVAGGPARPPSRHHAAPAPRPKPGPRQAKVELAAKSDVWVCLVDDASRKVIAGVVLSAGQSQGPFSSKRFQVTFGNGRVAMRINGRDAHVPASASPLGYEITAQKVKPLAAADRPTCA